MLPKSKVAHFLSQDICGKLYLCPPRPSIDDICEILQWILLITGLNNYAKFSKKSKKSHQRGEKATTTASKEAPHGEGHSRNTSLFHLIIWMRTLLVSRPATIRESLPTSKTSKDNDLCCKQTFKVQPLLSATLLYLYELQLAISSLRYSLSLFEN